MHAQVTAQNMLGMRLTHCSLQSRYDLLIQSLALLLDYRDMSMTVITHWKKSEHICRSPPLRFRQRMLLSAASWHGSKYSLYALLCLVSADSKWQSMRGAGRHTFQTLWQPDQPTPWRVRSSLSLCWTL
jgi:hypothetical protein